MTMLELVHPRPDWLGALEVALTRPAGVPERRAGDDPWAAADPGRPRRISDDLAWLRQAVDEPELNGLRRIGQTAAVAIWEAESEPPLKDRLERLRQRGILDAAGFLLHDADETV
jgi:hypothetical protein